MDRPIIFSAPMIRAIRREIAAPGTGKTQTRRILKPQPPTPEQFPGSDFGFDRAVADGVKVYSLNDLDRPPKHPTKWDLCGSVGVARNAGFPTTYRVPFTVGDRLWVKENWRTSVGCDDRRPSSMEVPGGGYGWPVWYEADGGAVTWRGSDNGGPAFVNPGKLRPSIHMSRWASRLTLLVTDVRVERLNAISEADAIAEGMPDFGSFCESLDPDALNVAGETASETASRLRWPQRWFASLWNDINGADAWDANPWVVAVSFQPFETNIDRMPERQAAPVPAAAE